MFQTVRHWWGSGRGKVTFRLFAFEFVVVMAGVLAAQALQNWVANRSAADAMEEARVRTLHEQSGNLANAEAWLAAIPCLDRRMQDIMRSAASGTIDPSQVERPKFADFVESRVDDRSELLMRARYGDRLVDRYVAMRSNLAFAQSDVGTIVHSWGRLNLGDPRLGRVSEADRSAVRIAAADIRAELRGLRYALADFVVAAARSQVASRSDVRTRPPRTCLEIWRAGAVAIPR